MSQIVGYWRAAAAPTRYACSGAPDYVCSEDPAGEYETLAACEAACVAPPRYTCSGAPNWTCSEDPAGEYETLEACEAACVAPPVNACYSCDPAIPDTLYVTLAGLAGDFAQFNGKHTVNWIRACNWKSNGGVWPYVYLHNPNVNTWQVEAIVKQAATCNKQWSYSTPTPYYCSPWDGVYSEDICGDSSCTDTNSCENSAGATCVVSLT